MPIQFLNRTNSGGLEISNKANAGSLRMYVAGGTPTPPTPATGSVYQQLDTIAAYLRTNITDLRNNNFYPYRLDGTQYAISDGGSDMFDGGNFTIPWYLSGINYTNQSVVSNTIAVNYASSSTAILDTNFNYVSLGYEQYNVTQSATYLPLTVLGSRSVSGSTGFQKAGNIGADGGGNINSGSIYVGSVVNGFTVYAAYRQTFGQASDPTICDVYMLMGHPNWGSTFGTVISGSQPSKTIQGGFLYSSGSATKEVLAIATLLSRTGSVAIPESEIKTVVDNYTLRIKQALSF